MAAASSTTFGRWGTPPHPVELSYAAEVPRHHAGHSAASPPLAGRCGRAARPAHRRSTGCSQGLVSPNGVNTAAGDRLGHSAGCSLTDYLTLRAATPDAIRTQWCGPPITPWCWRSCAIARMPRSRSSRTAAGRPWWVGSLRRPGAAHRGGLRPHVRHPVDRRRLLVVTVQPGITGPVLERSCRPAASPGAICRSRGNGPASAGTWPPVPPVDFDRLRPQR